MNTAEARVISTLAAKAINRVEEATFRAIQRLEEACYRAIDQARSSGTQVGATTGFLPWDITTEILSWLPVKSLMQFKCVSKSFYDLISNDSVFKRKHLYHHQSSLKVLGPHSVGGRESVSSCCVSSLFPAGDACEDIIELEYPIVLAYMDGHIYDSFDGLFCIGSYGGDVMIWNPTTREAKEFPGGRHLVDHENLHPAWKTYSLAHDSRSNVYKLLGIFKYAHNTCILRFYSTEMEMWRCVEDSCPQCGYINYDANSAIVNGAFHWLGCPDEYFETPHVVISLDVSDETYGTFAMPQALCHTAKNPRLCVLKGKLCVLCESNSETCREIWVMKEYGVVDSMTRMFSFSCVELPNIYCRPLCMLEDDTILIYRFLTGPSFYKDGRFLCNLTFGKFTINSFPFVYFESLISPHTLFGETFSSKIVTANKFSATTSRDNHSPHTLPEKALSSEIVANNFSPTMSRGEHVATKKLWRKHYLQRLCCCKSF